MSPFFIFLITILVISVINSSIFSLSMDSFHPLAYIARPCLSACAFVGYTFPLFSPLISSLYFMCWHIIEII